MPGDGELTLGIDVGGTKMLGLALGPDGTVLAERRVPSPQPLPGHHPDPLVTEAILDDLAVMVDELCSAVAAGGGPEPAAVGVGMPGLVDASGTLRVAPNLPAGDGLAVSRLLAERTGRQVVTDNDATCATVAEWALGAAIGADDVLMAALGTGIGGGIVSGGRVVRGAQGFAGEIGHTVVDPRGPLCTCGRRGCWERFASGSGLARLAREVAHAGRLADVVERAGGDPEAVRGEHVTAAAVAGDGEARAVLEELAWWVALGLANLCAVLDPALVVLGGGLVEAVTLVLPTIRTTFVSMLEGASQRPEIGIVPAALGERAGAIGAALAARHDDRTGIARS